MRIAAHAEAVRCACVRLGRRIFDRIEVVAPCWIQFLVSLDTTCVLLVKVAVVAHLHLLVEHRTCELFLRRRPRGQVLRLHATEYPTPNGNQLVIM